MVNCFARSDVMVPVAAVAEAIPMSQSVGKKAAPVFPAPIRPHTDLFSDLDAEARRWVFALGREVILEKGDAVMTQDRKCGNFYIVQSGMFAFQKCSESGLVFELGRAQAGEFFGEQFLLGDRLSEIQVVTLDRAAVRVFRASDFRKVLNQYPSVARRMLDAMTARLSHFANLSFELATMKLEVRLRRILRDLALQADQLFDGGIIQPAPRHADLAAMLGTTREVISRAMMMLNRNGTITTSRKQIIIRSARLLCFGDRTIALE